jgi:hypothetical protein
VVHASRVHYVVLAIGMALVLILVRPDSATGADGGISRWNLFAPVSTQPVDTKPHPAVVRVIVEEGRVITNGSGSYVAARDQYGLVVTNWHVVRDAKGPIQIVFADGFRSEAKVLKTDSDWDLAALLIWRPKVEPLPICTTAPQPGDPLTIAGYGQGDYRSVTGKCTQYLAPSVKHPYEFVELSAKARQGDSGGPILNDRGELAGVLFGADRATTSGSYCGRVRWFLSSVWPDLDAPGSTPPTNPLVGYQPESPISAEPNPNPSTNLVPIQPIEPTTSSNPAPEPERTYPDDVPFSSPGISLPPLPTSTPTSSSWSWKELAGTTRLDHAKSVLAIIGLLAIWRVLSRGLAG